MPALMDADALFKRQYYCNGRYTSGGRCYSAWDSWARWVVLAIIIVGALVIFFLFSCISARRRRKMGYAPYRGTGWAAPGGTGAAPPPPEQYNQQPYYASNNYNAPPPQYGYYGGNNTNNTNDVELQQPSSTYAGYGAGQNGYAPPSGPPPRKA